MKTWTLITYTMMSLKKQSAYRLLTEIKLGKAELNLYLRGSILKRWKTNMDKLVFIVEQAEEGGYNARGRNWVNIHPGRNAWKIKSWCCWSDQMSFWWRQPKEIYFETVVETQHFASRTLLQRLNGKPGNAVTRRKMLRLYGNSPFTL